MPTTFIAKPRAAMLIGGATRYEARALLNGATYVLGYSARRTDAGLRGLFASAVPALERLHPGFANRTFRKRGRDYVAGVDVVGWSGRTEREAAFEAHGGYARVAPITPAVARGA